jgi:DNA-directed RNA polymerase specialized sigma24 family protein
MWPVPGRHGPAEAGGVTTDAREPAPSPPSDDVVWADRRVDQCAGVDALYRAHASPLLRYVRQLAAERGVAEAQLDSEGVVQEAFAVLMRYRGTVDNPAAWLCTVARRMVGRAQAAQRRHAGGDAATHLDAGAARWHTLSQYAALEDTAYARQVVGAIAQLPDR